MKYFRVIIAVNDDTIKEDIKDILSHFDGNTEVETGIGKVTVPNVEEIEEVSKQYGAYVTNNEYMKQLEKARRR